MNEMKLDEVWRTYGHLKGIHIFGSIMTGFLSRLVVFRRREGGEKESLGHFGQVWAALGKSGPLWASLGHFGQVWASLGKSGPL